MMSQNTAQLLAELLKAHGIRKIIAVQGTAKAGFRAVVRDDPFFQVCASIDERSACYMACGMSAESGEPVVLACSEEGSSRSCFPAMTEAYYRQLPILAVTQSGRGRAQFTDSTSSPRDCAKITAHIPAIASEEDSFRCAAKINEVILELTRNGGGPAVLSIEAEGNHASSEDGLPSVQAIDRIEHNAKPLPAITAKRVGIFVGPHSEWSTKLTALADAFCEKYNGVVFCADIGGYKGKYAINPGFMNFSQRKEMDLMIHVGLAEGVSPALRPSEVWSVDPAGRVSDVSGKLRCVFQMTEEEFFARYVELAGGSALRQTEYYSAQLFDHPIGKPRHVDQNIPNQIAYFA